MPLGNKTSGTLVAEVKMSRMSHDGAFLVVEGRDDVRFWRTRRHASCELVDGEGKKNVLGCISRLDSESFKGALGIVDNDYDSLMGVHFESRNLLATDAHDLESLLCRSSALDAILAEYGSPSKIARFESTAGVDVRTGLLERALVFGRLRWATMRHEPTVSLDRIKVPRFVDENTWNVDREGLIRAAVGADSPDGACELASRIARLPEADPWYVVRGREMIEILRIGLRRVLGDIRASVGYDDLARVLRVAMSRDDLEATKLGAGMRAWGVENHPYAVIAE